MRLSCTIRPVKACCVVVCCGVLWLWLLCGSKLPFVRVRAHDQHNRAQHYKPLVPSRAALSQARVRVATRNRALTVKRPLCAPAQAHNNQSNRYLPRFYLPVPCELGIWIPTSYPCPSGRDTADSFGRRSPQQVHLSTKHRRSRWIINHGRTRRRK